MRNEKNEKEEKYYSAPNLEDQIELCDFMVQKWTQLKESIKK